MDKRIFIINGSGGVGKDTFVKLVSQYVPTVNFSSVDKVKEVAGMIGWNGRKTERDRKFLSDLKLLSTDYCDMPYNSMKNKVKDFLKDANSKFLFLHIREPEEIERARREFKASTVLIVRDCVEHITSNMADKNVLNYDYDYIIENNGTLGELNKKAHDFCNDIICEASTRNEVMRYTE